MMSPAVNPPPILIRINGRVKCRLHLLQVGILDAVVLITKEALSVNEIVVWPVIAGLLVMIVEHLLSEYRQKHADTSAHHDGHN
jgi:hypothetical protein